MGGCSCKTTTIRIPMRQQQFRRSSPTPPAPKLHSETVSPTSDISCNFIYDSEGPDLITAIAAALAILVVSVQDEYDICVICTDRSATMKTTICNHKLLCTRCYIGYCLTKCEPRCPLCREKMDVNDPFALS